MDIMDKKTVQDNLCKEFCVYYKPSKDDEIACGGYIVVERLIARGRKLSFVKFDRNAGPAAGERLKEVLCPSCPFYESDCDFILNEGDATPCGGFILLSQQIENGVICVDDVRDI